MNEHTPTPWHVTGRHHIGGGGFIVTLASVNPSHVHAAGNAEHIVRCVNKYDALVDALQAILAQTDPIPGGGEYIRDNDTTREAIVKARAALSDSAIPGMWP